MAIYYCAIDDNEKKRIEPPSGFSCKSPEIYYPNNPFPNMVAMKNIQGYNFYIINDMGAEYELACEYEDITEQVYEEYIKKFPWSQKEIYEKRGEMEVTIDITNEVAEYSVSDLINLLQFLQKSGFNKTYFDSYNSSICLIRDKVN